MRAVVGFLALALVVVVAVTAVWRSWVGFTMRSSQDTDQTTLAMTINERRVADDLQQLGQKAQEVAQTADVAVETRSARGVIADISASQVKLTTDDKESLVAQINEATEVIVDASKAEPTALKTGDRATVSYREKDGAVTALRISVEHSAGV